MFGTLPVAALLPVLLGGCFSYVALGSVPPARGADVVAKLGVPLDIGLQDITVHDIQEAVGKVAYADADSVVVVVERFRSGLGTDYPGLGTTVAIPRSHIADLEQRRVSAGRTSLLLATGAAALVAIVYSVRQLTSSTSNPSPPPPPPQP
jgi:hypothetical protein